MTNVAAQWQQPQQHQASVWCRDLLNSSCACRDFSLWVITTEM